MAGPKTQGFALSALPTSPRIPDNVGLLDVKSIYDGVKRGLDSFEAVRRAPQSMLLADAQTAAETAQAPLATRLALAQTQGVEQQTPLNTAILAEKASPGYMAAQRQALLNKSTRAPSAATQLARNYADAVAAADEDPTNKLKTDLAEAYRLQVNKAGATTAADPVAATAAGVAKNAATNATNTAIATGRNATQTSIATDRNATNTAIADANRDTKETLTAAQLALKESLAKQGFSQSEINAKIAAQGRVDSARATFTGKVYEAATLENKKVQESMAALNILDEKSKQFVDSNLGSGVFVGSSPMIAMRSLLGDQSGKEMDAAVSLSMTTAIDTMRGLGAMSEKEFNAAMSQLPRPNEPKEAILVKLDYLNTLRPWLAARNNLFLERLEAGDSALKAHAIVRKSLPLIGADGKIVDPLTTSDNAASASIAANAQTSGAATPPGPSQPSPSVSPEQKAAAQAWLDANPNDPRAQAVRAKAGL